MLPPHWKLLHGLEPDSSSLVTMTEVDMSGGIPLVKSVTETSQTVDDVGYKIFFILYYKALRLLLCCFSSLLRDMCSPFFCFGTLRTVDGGGGVGRVWNGEGTLTLAGFTGDAGDRRGT